MPNTFNNTFFLNREFLSHALFAFYHSLQSFTLPTIVEKAGDPGNSNRKTDAAKVRLRFLHFAGYFTLWDQQFQFFLIISDVHQN